MYNLQKLNTCLPFYFVFGGWTVENLTYVVTETMPANKINTLEIAPFCSIKKQSFILHPFDHMCD